MATTVNNTMVKIQTVTVGSGGASSIDFTSIPQTYTDLVIKTSARNTSTSTTMYLEFNGSGGTAYSVRLLYGDGSAAGSTSSSSRANIKNDGGADDSGYTASTFASSEIYIPNYTSSNYKSVSIDGVPENNATTTYMNMVAGLWSSTSAITSIKLTLYTGNFAQYSTATLYGVTATPNTTKASGGIIYQDATYMYHVFPYTSTFTPLTALSCDILAVAGGGGGGDLAYGGGGGAGGLVYNASQSLTATPYTVTVGGGGARGVPGSNSQFASLTAAVGGGKGGQSDAAPGAQGNGGCGGGAGGSGGNTNLSGGTGSQGYNGGSTITPTPGVGASSGGGGMGAVGGSINSSGATISGSGGVGISTYSSWAIATNSGQIVSGTGYYAGGGGGGIYSGTAGLGGSGGGGNGSNSSTAAGSGVALSGGGGGGSGTTANGGSGGSGVVIIRYAK
jgi:hypothetical protein